MQAYTEFELVNSAADDWKCVLDEGHRRQDAARAKVDRLQRQIAKAQAEVQAAHRIIKAATNAAMQE